MSVMISFVLFHCSSFTVLGDDRAIFSFGESQPLSASNRKGLRSDRIYRGNSSKALRKGHRIEEETESDQTSEEKNSSEETQLGSYVWKGSRKSLLLHYFMLVWSKLCDHERIVFDEKVEQSIRQDLKPKLNDSEISVIIRYVKLRTLSLR